MQNHTCCFFGHRKIEITDDLREKLYNIIEPLITEENMDTFLFGSRSQFDSLCLETVSKLKEKYPHIKRVYVRAEYPFIDENYRSYLLKLCDSTYYPDRLLCAGNAVYVERNREMIEKSGVCVVYYKENYLPPRQKNSRRNLTDYQPQSGTKLAYHYAVKKKKRVINLATI